MENTDLEFGDVSAECEQRAQFECRILAGRCEQCQTAVTAQRHALWLTNLGLQLREYWQIPIHIERFAVQTG